MSIKITTQQISMRYKERVLFHIPELSIGPNDAIYLKGDNGVGKTTLLKILSGLSRALAVFSHRYKAGNISCLQG